MNLNEFIQKEIKTTINGLISEGKPIPMDTPNELVYIDFSKYASKNTKMFKKELQKSNGDGGRMFLTLSALWYKWARQNQKEFTHIKDSKKFGRALMVMMVKDDLIFDRDAWKKNNDMTHLKEDEYVDQAFNDAKPVEEETKRDYKKEYAKYGKSTKAKKYRAELNKYNRDKGTYGNGDGKDASHKGGKIVGFEDESKNRGRAEKSRLKKESVNEATSKYPNFDLDKNIRYQSTSISKGMWRYTGKEQGGKGVYRNLNNNQFLGFSSDDFKYFKKHLKKHFDIDESVNEEKVYIDFLNKKKGFKRDRIKFNSYEAAVKWAKKNLEKYDQDMIHYESVNEGKYYITRNLGRGQGKSLIKHYDRKKNQTTDKPIEFKSYKDAQKEVEKRQRGGSMGGQMTAYIITDKKMNPLTEEQLDEKLITFSNRAPYGQVVFMAGGAGSGKGFAISNFIDSAGFKVRDVDEMKKSLAGLEKIKKFSVDKWYKKYGKNLSDKAEKGGLSPKAHVEEYVLGSNKTIQDIAGDLKNPNNVASLHYIVDSMGLKDKWVINMLNGKNNKETLPNLMFDITAKKVASITSVVKPLMDAGYDSKNVHLIWVLKDYKASVRANKTRDRVVPQDILLQTHEGASETMWHVITKILPKGLNGRIDVVLNNNSQTAFFVDKKGDKITVEPNQQNKFDKAQPVVKGFTSLPVKKQGGGILPEKVWQNILVRWILGNAPESIDLDNPEQFKTQQVKVGESVNEASDTYFKTAGEAVDFAKTKAEKKGYEIDEDDWNNQITHGGRYSRLRPSVGKTHTFQIGLLKKGKPQRKGLSISLFGMDSGNYELTYYIN